MKVMLGLLFALWTSLSYAAWPSLPFPAGAKVEAIGDEVRLNGVPMRMYRVLSTQDKEAVLDFYRAALGDGYTEAKVHRVNILSQMQGKYFVSVRVVSVGSNVTETLIAISDGGVSQALRGAPLGFVLPAGSILLSDMESLDAGKNARQLIFNNQHSLHANKNFVISALQNKGYQLQPQYTQEKESSISFMFEGHRREAMVVVTRDGDKTNVVMTTILSQ